MIAYQMNHRRRSVAKPWWRSTGRVPADTDSPKDQDHGHGDDAEDLAAADVPARGHGAYSRGPLSATRLAPRAVMRTTVITPSTSRTRMTRMMSKAGSPVMVCVAAIVTVSPRSLRALVPSFKRGRTA